MPINVGLWILTEYLIDTESLLRKFMVANLPWYRTPIIFYSSLRNRKFFSARFEPLFSSTFTLPTFYSVLHFELLFSSSNMIRATAQLLLLHRRTKPHRSVAKSGTSENGKGTSKLNCLNKNEAKNFERIHYRLLFLAYTRLMTYCRSSTSIFDVY